MRSGTFGYGRRVASGHFDAHSSVSAPGDRLHFPDSPLGGLRIPSSPLIALRHPGGCFARVANPIAKFFIRDLVSRKTGLTL